MPSSNLNSQAILDPAVSNLSQRLFVGDPVDLELRHLYMETDLDWALLVVGNQQIVWGQADGRKILDVVIPQNFREFILEDFSDSRISLWSLNLKVPIGHGERPDRYGWRGGDRRMDLRGRP